jgi:hypothetical protein
MSRHTYRVAISNNRLIAFDASGVTVRRNDYRCDGTDRQQVTFSGPTSSFAASCSMSNGDRTALAAHCPDNTACGRNEAACPHPSRASRSWSYYR